MVEHGIVKWFNRKPLSQGGQFGFIRVLGDDGQPTGEEIFFHLTRLMTVELDTTNICPTFGKRVSSWRQAQPQKGQRVVFERDVDMHGRVRAESWNFYELWEAQERILNDERELEWRIVLKGYWVTGIRRQLGTVDETDRSEFIARIMWNTRKGSVAQACRWTSRLLGFYDPIDDDLRQGYDNYRYWLQVKLPSGRWLNLRALTPLPEPEPDYPDDDDLCYEDEDPLAGDIDDGSNYVPGPNPLTTQHYHALQSRGLL